MVRLEGSFVGHNFKLEFETEQQLKAFICVSEYLLTLMDIKKSEPKGIYERLWNDLNRSN
jgi:hypothetical protein